MLKSDAAEEACAYLTSVLHTNPLLLTELDLSGKKPGDSGVKQFCALLGDSHCTLKTLKLVFFFHQDVLGGVKFRNEKYSRYDTRRGLSFVINSDVMMDRKALLQC